MQRRLLWTAALLLTGACIHIAPRPVDPAATAQALESRSLADANMQAFVAARSTAKPPIARWDLDTLTLAAFYFHPGLDVTRAQAAVARAAIVTAGERPNPTISIPIEHKAEAHPWITVIDIDVPIETANKRGLRRREATDAARAADLAIAQQAWQVRSSIRAQLVALNAADAAIAALDRQRAVQQDLVEALQKRLELGEGSQVELAQARISARQSEMLRLDRIAQRAQARARLAASIGIPESGLGDVAVAFDAPLMQSPPDLRERALITRPDVLMALADYAASESALRLELAKQYPDIHIAPGLGWDQGARRWDLGFSATLPIFSRNRGAIGEAVARRSLSETRFIALQSNVIAAVDEASAAYREAMHKVDEAAAVVTIQKRQLEVAQHFFEAGEADRVALRTAELELQTATLAHAEAVRQAQTALGALEDAVEQPLNGSRIPAVPATTARETR
ncbi:MAG TPA: TolC family protein [Thermoanaerobaculia bacterium]|nr:TolC family protein [Thermoanaerobaculia bacterium]